MTEDRFTVGIVTPHTAAGPEVELPTVMRRHLDTIVSRTGSTEDASQTAPPAHAALRASTGPAAIERAAADFTGSAVAAVAHASTTAGYVIGHREELRLVDRLSERCGVPAVASCAAAAAALRAQGVDRVQLVHPPWFDEEFDELGLAYFRGHGFDAVVTRAVGLPEDPARVEPQEVGSWVEQHLADAAQAVFLAGNGFRAAAAIEGLERRTGRLVVEANQALLWGILAATHVTQDVTGYGRLLRSGPAFTESPATGAPRPRRAWRRFPRPPGHRPRRP